MYVSKDTRLLLVAEYTLLALVLNQNQADRWVNGLPPYPTSTLPRYDMSIPLAGIVNIRLYGIEIPAKVIPWY